MARHKSAAFPPPSDPDPRGPAARLDTGSGEESGSAFEGESGSGPGLGAGRFRVRVAECPQWEGEADDEQDAMARCAADFGILGCERPPIVERVEEVEE